MISAVSAHYSIYQQFSRQSYIINVWLLTLNVLLSYTLAECELYVCWTVWEKKILWDCRKHSRENRVSPSVVVTKQNMVFSAQCCLLLLFLLLPHTSYIDMLWNWNNICMYDLDHHLRLCRTYTHEQHLIRRACFRCTTFYKWIYLQVIKTASAAINETNMLFSVFWCHIIKHAAISFRRINHTFMISIFFRDTHIQQN